MHTALSTPLLAMAQAATGGGILDMIIYYGVRAIGAIILFILARYVARWASRSMGKVLQRAGIEATLSAFFAKATGWLVMILALLSILTYFGVDVTAFAAVIGGAALAIGLAFQGSLSNIAAGVMLLIFRPFKKGDVVNIGGRTGKVDEIELFSTTLDTPDNRRIILPNSKVFGTEIENITFHQHRRVDVAVGTDYGADLKQVRAVLDEAARKIHDQFESNPEHSIKEILHAAQIDPNAFAYWQVVLLELGASSIDWQVRVWGRTGDFFAIKEALTQAVKDALDAANISIPFPQMDVHIDNNSEALVMGRSEAA